jgi:hypothetical protein
MSGAAFPYLDALTAYLVRLEASDVDGLAALFAPDATVLSPFLGSQAPRPFFTKVRAASGRSRIEPLDIFASVRGQPCAVCYFNYHWQLKDGSAISFACVDVFDFDAAGLIERLTIVYDTHPVRQVVADKYA